MIIWYYCTHPLSTGWEEACAAMTISAESERGKVPHPAPPSVLWHRGPAVYSSSDDNRIAHWNAASCSCFVFHLERWLCSVSLQKIRGLLCLSIQSTHYDEAASLQTPVTGWPSLLWECEGQLDPVSLLPLEAGPPRRWRRRAFSSTHCVARLNVALPRWKNFTKKKRMNKYLLSGRLGRLQLELLRGRNSSASDWPLPQFPVMRTATEIVRIYVKEF